MPEVRGNQTLTGAWGELWIGGEKVFEIGRASCRERV